MTGPLGAARFAQALMAARLPARLRQLEAEDDDIAVGWLDAPKLVSFTEPEWPLGIDQVPAVILTVRNAGSSVLDDVSAAVETWKVTYEVAAEVILTHPDIVAADVARYAYVEAIRRVWLSARGEPGVTVLPGFAEAYDTVVKDPERGEWMTQATSVVQIEVTELYPTGRVVHPVASLNVQTAYVEADEPLNVPVHPALRDNTDPTPATIRL